MSCTPFNGVTLALFIAVGLVHGSLDASSSLHGRAHPTDFNVACKRSIDCHLTVQGTLQAYCDPIDFICRCPIGSMPQPLGQGFYECHRVSCEDCHLNGWRCTGDPNPDLPCVCGDNTTELSPVDDLLAIRCLADMTPLTPDQLPKCSKDAECNTYTDEHRHHAGVSWCNKGKCQCGVGNFPRVANQKSKLGKTTSWGCDWLWCDPANETGVCKANNWECRVIDSQHPKDFACQCPKGSSGLHYCHPDASSEVPSSKSITNSPVGHASTGSTHRSSTSAKTSKVHTASFSPTTASSPFLLIAIGGGCLLVGLLLLVGIICCCVKSSRSKEKDKIHRKGHKRRSSHRTAAVPEKLTGRSISKPASPQSAYSNESSALGSNINSKQAEAVNNRGGGSHSKQASKETGTSSSAYSTSSSAVVSASKPGGGGDSSKQNSSSYVSTSQAKTSPYSQAGKLQTGKNKLLFQTKTPAPTETVLSVFKGSDPIITPLLKQSKAANRDVSQSIFTSAISHK